MGRTLIKCLDWRLRFDEARKRVTVEYEIQGDERTYVIRRLTDGLVGANGSSYTHDQVKKGDVLRRPGFHHVEDARWFITGFCIGVNERQGHINLVGFTPEDYEQYRGLK